MVKAPELIELRAQDYGRGRKRGSRSRKSPCHLPVPQTDTGIRDEYSKARESNLLKELGKMAPYLR